MREAVMFHEGYADAEVEAKAIIWHADHPDFG